jgi:hypothetical protein
MHLVPFSKPGATKLSLDLKVFGGVLILSFCSNCWLYIQIIVDLLWICIYGRIKQIGFDGAEKL